MNICATVKITELRNVRKSTRVYQNATITDIFLDPSENEKFPGMWWGIFKSPDDRVYDVYCYQTFGNNDNPSRGTWRNGQRIETSEIKTKITTKDVCCLLKEHNIQQTTNNVNAVCEYLSGIAFAYVSAEMQDANREDILKWLN